MESVRRLFIALDYPRTKEFNVLDPQEVCKLVCWAEDRKLREYDIEQRGPLRELGPDWNDIFQAYLIQLESPYRWSNSRVDQIKILRWLLTKALACEYEDEGKKYNAVVSGPAQQHGIANGGHGPDQPLSQIFTKKVSAIASRLGIGPSHDMQGTLQAICTVIQFKIAPLAFEVGSPRARRMLDIDEFPLGYSTKDPIVDRVARALTMLYLTDLRELQNNINGLLVSAQEFTANPKTNTALGKVGRLPS